MKDRIPSAPGQFLLNITAEQLQKFLAGQQCVITLVRNDQPTVVGTPYNKVSVLPDNLAKRLCPEIEDPTPADALKANSQVFVATLLADGWQETIVDTVTSYTQTVECSGMLSVYDLMAPQVPSTGIKDTDTALKEGLDTLCEAGNSGESLDGQLKWTCYNTPPTVDLPLYFYRSTLDKEEES